MNDIKTVLLIISPQRCSTGHSNIAISTSVTINIKEVKEEVATYIRKCYLRRFHSAIKSR